MTILNQSIEQIKIGYTWGLSNESIFLFLLGIILIVAGIFLIREVEWHERNVVVMLFFTALTLVLGVTFVVGGFHAKPIYKEITQYEVTISPITPFHMIYDNYEIVEQRGDIFVLQEKNQNDG